MIAGGTTGIGRAAAALMASQGAKVLISGRTPEHMDDALKYARQSGDVEGTLVDLAEHDSVLRFFEAADEKLGGVDVLINCLGIATRGVAETSYEDLSYQLRTNLLSYMDCAAQAIGRIKRRGGGHVVNLGSMSANVREVNSGIYTAAKAAIQGWSESLRKTYNRDGIRVSLIEPGNVDTDLHADTRETHRELVESEEMLTAEDLAELILYCLLQPRRCDIIMARVRPHMQFI